MYRTNSAQLECEAIGLNIHTVNIVSVPHTLARDTIGSSLDSLVMPKVYHMRPREPKCKNQYLQPAAEFACSCNGPNPAYLLRRTPR